MTYDYDCLEIGPAGPGKLLSEDVMTRRAGFEFPATPLGPRMGFF